MIQLHLHIFAATISYTISDVKQICYKIIKALDEGADTPDSKVFFYCPINNINYV